MSKRQSTKERFFTLVDRLRTTKDRHASRRNWRKLRLASECWRGDRRLPYELRLPSVKRSVTLMRCWASLIVVAG